MKPELIIWDWNGTILDDALVCKTIANIMLAERGIPTLPDMDAYRAVFGFPIKAYYERMGYRFGPDDEPYETVADEFVVLYDELYRTSVLRPGSWPFSTNSMLKATARCFSPPPAWTSSSCRGPPSATWGTGSRRRWA